MLNQRYPGICQRSPVITTAPHPLSSCSFSFLCCQCHRACCCAEPCRTHRKPIPCAIRAVEEHDQSSSEAFSRVHCLLHYAHRRIGCSALVEGETLRLAVLFLLFCHLGTHLNWCCLSHLETLIIQDSFLMHGPLRQPRTHHKMNV